MALLDQKITWEEYQSNHSAEMRERMILQSMPLVRYQLGRLGIHGDIGAEYEDLVHQGILGLIDAVDRYDPSHGAQFSTYATLRIRGKILDYLRVSDWMSRSARQRVRSIQKTVAHLWGELKREPTEEEIASHLGVELEVVEKGLVEFNLTIVSLDLPVEMEQDDSADWHDLVKDDKQPNPLELMEDQGLKQILMEGIKKLGRRDQTLLSLYYFDNLTFKEIGKVLGLTESRVCQLHARIILNLKVIVKNEQAE